MTEKYEVVVVGGGHNGLIAACYLAKAGVNVCVVEQSDRIGGGAMTRELIAPGFLNDICSVAHTMLQANPLLRNDELELQSRYGLKYVNPEKMTAAIFEDGRVLEFYTDMERTCQSIAQFSQHDADAYRRFNQQVFQMLDMLVMGMYNIPPSAGMQAAMLDQSPQGQEMMRAQSISSWALIDEWFEDERVKIGLTRYASEAMTNPFDNGTGFGFYIILPFMHKFGSGIPVGGSGALTQALARCLEDHGGTIKLNSRVKEFIHNGEEVRGIVLDSGEEILASKAVVSTLNAKQVFPQMLPGAQLPEGFERRVQNNKFSSIQPFVVHLALHEEPQYKIGSQVDEFFWIEKSHSHLEDFAQAFRDMEYGKPRRDFAAYVGQHKVDKTRVPEGKSMMHIYAFAPYNLKGGAQRWDEIGKEVADGFVADMRELTTNMGDDNIIGMAYKTPLDIERHNPAMLNADILHIGAYNWQLGGNRPVPGWGQYKTPLAKFYMAGASTHPGGGITGGSGRNVAQVLFEDLGLDFDRLIG
ncbi:NAD(P)/FAD-dependent oxidoreductase [Pseudomonas sp. NBRC 100443]|uniref:phytoene desaturase family protein n=1 Tax=Pseudomonas sp. NBRC 100443 TaxID=1113665 RepID=UPI0024A0AAA2|nr:NAD(P)/FAD-dependent oxidoreductase [Pseudomonas sp. NBRC 100443]GLU37310.1 FAD-dependent oxidoreductase [Pseudomonas sp. NBRC 100443]